jgi:rhamnulokinase
MFAELRAGLERVARLQIPIRGISADSWGLDYLLFDTKDALIEPAYHYRDGRCSGGVERMRSCLDHATVFEETGVQFLPFNTLYQLAAESPDRLARAGRVLMVGDAFNFLLSGVAKAEMSLASTSQLFNPRTQAWSTVLLDALQLPRHLMPPLVPSGTVLGPALRTLLGGDGLDGASVIAGCSHDTGAAVAAVPATGGDWAYISSGTWSLMGVERMEPVIGALTRELNFTNEIGYGRTIRLLKNISGLWLVQECRRHWAATGMPCDYPTLTRLASEAPAFVSLIDPADPRFVAPDCMPREIAGYCRETHQPVPESPGAVLRCALESLALLYRQTLDQLERVTGIRPERIHIVGGGSQNRLLNQFTANACRLPVWAGPQEATSAGNILIQALALGRLPSLQAARRIVRDSFPVSVYDPESAPGWREAHDRFNALASRTQPDSL